MALVSVILRSVFLLGSLFLLGTTNDAARPAGLVPAVHVLEADDQIYRLAAEGGYERVVQVFPWRDIEPTAGEWHWQQYDFAVQAARYYKLGLIVRLDHPPDWALRQAEEAGISPFDLDAYAGFVTAVAERYRGQAQAYIVWNEPNLSREWAGQMPDAEAYTALLCRAHAAIKAADPGATVVSAGLAPTNGGDGALDDRLFLQAMYEAGAGACFDVLGAHAYGFGHPPNDARDAHDGLNLARLTGLREIMEANADSARPVWITEMGWTTAGAGLDTWQTVSMAQQASYLAGAWQHIRTEWPWVQIATIWNLNQGLPETDEMAGYSLLHADGSPKPAYYVLRTLLATDSERRLGRWLERLITGQGTAPSAEIPILAADEIVHLGDNQ